MMVMAYGMRRIAPRYAAVAAVRICDPTTLNAAPIVLTSAGAAVK